MTLGFFSPLPPSHTGVADYSAALLGALRETGLVELRDGDINLYHLGNNQLHGEIYRRALDRPGVIVLHDAVLHHFLLGTLPEAEYVTEFTYNYGVWCEDLARALWQGRARSAADPQYFRYPMLMRVVERSRAVVVHNPGAARLVRDHVADALIHEIPHLFEQPQLPAASEIAEFRNSLGIGPRTFLFGVFGHLRESKRLAAVLRAFAQARSAGADVALLVAGDFASSDLKRAVAPQLTGEGIHCLGYAPEREFWLHAAAVDACINLRYPAAGETSGISIRLMGIAKPVVMTGSLETSRFPDAACLRVDSGAGEEEMLAEFMLWLAKFPADARAIGQRAGAHIREFHDPARVAEQYWQAIRACYD